jgi:hypothetical protein
MKDQPESEHSATERRLGRLVVPAPDRYNPSKRIDWIHDPDLELLGGPE